jgi:amino acid transporter
MNKAHVRKASLFYFVFVMYSYTTAGPFGLEGVVAASGPGMALLYDLVLPFFWCIPMSLVSAELTTAMPVAGGFYRWVRAAFGDFWGFLAGWWNWMAAFLLASAYAVLFADYLGFYFPGLTGWKHTLLAVSLIWVVAYINLRGIQLVGVVATILEIACLVPVVVLCAASVPYWRHNPFVPLVPPHRPPFEIFGVGLALGLWGYSGYEQVSTVAEEVENPQRTYPRALAWVVPLSMLTYFLPTFCSLAALGNWGQWNTRLLRGRGAGHWRAGSGNRDVACSRNFERRRAQ